MKALELLRRAKKYNANITDKEINEAIAELEALQQRSCDKPINCFGCKLNPENLEYNEDKCIYARECNRCACSYYEIKDKQ